MLDGAGAVCWNRRMNNAILCPACNECSIAFDKTGWARCEACFERIERTDWISFISGEDHETVLQRESDNKLAKRVAVVVGAVWLTVAATILILSLTF